MKKHFLYTMALMAGSLAATAYAQTELPPPKASEGRPVHCSGGYQDSACNTTLLRAPQSAPTCSSTDGWVTVAPAKWIGSKWAAPVCNYTPQPSCPSGYVESSAAVWTGSSWTSPSCLQPPAPTCSSGYVQTSPPVWSGSSWSAPTCAPSSPKPSCAPGYSETTAPTYSGGLWVGQVCAPVSPAPTCPPGTTELAAATWNSTTSSWNPPSCTTVTPPPAPTCPSGYTMQVAPVWSGSSWSEPTCVPPSVPPAPTCGSGYTQTTAPIWNGSSWVGQVCSPTPPPPPPACTLGEMQTVAPTWTGTAWVGQVCTPGVPPTPTPPALPATIDYLFSATSGWAWFYWSGTISSASSSSFGPLSVKASGSTDCAWIGSGGSPEYLRCDSLTNPIDSEASSAYSAAASACDADSLPVSSWIDQCTPYVGTGVYPDSGACVFKFRSGKVGKTAWSCSRWWLYVADESGNPPGISKTISVRLQR